MSLWGAFHIQSIKVKATKYRDKGLIEEKGLFGLNRSFQSMVTWFCCFDSVTVTWNKSMGGKLYYKAGVSDRGDLFTA